MFYGYPNYCSRVLKHIAAERFWGAPELRLPLQYG
jgi:hypothetical protein